MPHAAIFSHVVVHSTRGIFRTEGLGNMTTPGKLTPKQKRFIEEFLLDLNGTAAYKRAGYNAKGHGAEVNAAKLLRNTEVASAIAEAKTERSPRTEASAEKVITELARIAFFDVRRAFNADGTTKPLDQIDDDTAAAISGIEAGEFGPKIKLACKLAALDKLARHLGLLNDKLTLQGSPENPLTLLIRRIQGSSIRPVEEGA
jgi:phage terminase small subunit